LDLNIELNRPITGGGLHTEVMEMVHVLCERKTLNGKSAIAATRDVKH
jgi:hypothetical protein